MKSTSSTWTPGDIVQVAFAIGLTVGAVFASTDLLMNRVTTSTAQAAQMILGTSLVSAIIALPCIVGFVLLARRIPRLPTEPALLAFTGGMGLQVVFLLTLSTRGAQWLAPVPWVCALMLYQLLNRKRPVNAVSRSMVIALCAAVFIPLLLVAGGLRGGKLMTLMTMLALVTPAFVLQAVAARFRLAVITPLILVTALIMSTGAQSRAWRENAVGETGLEATDPPKEASTSAAAGTVSPNVVLIVLDTTRADRLGCYGHTGKLTPRLDTFAAEGTLYEQAISAAPWTVPSHASLFTGWYTVTHGCDSDPHRWLDSGFVTLAEMLHTRGYETAALCANGYVYACNLLQGVGRYLELDQNAGHRGTKIYEWMSKAGGPQAWSDQGAQEAVTELSRWLSDRKGESKPFYLFVNLMEAHWPLRPPFAERKNHLMPGMGYLEATRIASQFYGPKWTAGVKRTAREEEAVRRMYNAEIAYQDSQLGNLLDTLRSLADLDNTLVMITADHGEGQGENGCWDHVFSLAEALIHVPLVIRYPAAFPAGTRITGQCQLVDIVPTVFDVLGVPCPVENLPGRTLVPERFQPRTHTYAEVHPYYGHLERMADVTGLKRDVAGFLGYLRTVRTDKYKFIWSERGRRELYDIAADPAEAHNLIDDFPSVAAELEKHMHEWWKAQPPYEPREVMESAPTSEDTLRGLRGLGYVK